MDLRRLFAHLATTHRAQRRAFPPALQQAIEAAIGAAETAHRAEIRFVVEAALEPLAVLRGQSPRERALEVFSLLRVWDTARDDGVLIYVLLADRAVEIVADRGVHAVAPGDAWTRICHRMEQAFRRGDHAAGSLAAIEAVADVLVQVAPLMTQRRNELPDEPVLM